MSRWAPLSHTLQGSKLSMLQFALGAIYHWAHIWQCWHWLTVFVADFCLFIVSSVCTVHWWEAIYGVDRRYIHVFSRFLGFPHTVSHTQNNIYLPVVFILDHIHHSDQAVFYKMTHFGAFKTYKPSNKCWLSSHWLIYMPTDSLSTSSATLHLCFPVK